MLDMANLDTLFSALNYSSVLADNGILNKAQKTSLARFVGKMTKSQMTKLNSKNDGLKTALQEAGMKASDIIAAGGATGVDPRKDANVQAVYKINASTAANNTAAMTAGVVFNSLNGNISHGRITNGGYDYHLPGVRSSADSKDFAAGVQIGSMLELAARMNKPLFIFVTTDGACASEASDGFSSNWSSDYSSSVQFIIAFDPSGKITSSGSQVGHYLEDQRVDTTTLVGSRPDYVAATILANYLSVNNKMDMFKQLAPATLQGDDLPKVVKLFKG
jgi:hypothetical protein